MKRREKNLSKLPAWAQDEIRRLNENVQYWKAKAAEIAGKKPSNTHLVTYEDTTSLQPLPSNSTVRFELGGSRHQDAVTVDVCVRGGELRLRGNDRLVMAPCAANDMRVLPMEPLD